MNKKIVSFLVHLLNESGYLIKEVRDALHYVRLIGNKVAHDSRPFRYSEALLSWEVIYTVVKWYMEVYGPIEVTVPDYRDPVDYGCAILPCNASLGKKRHLTA